VSTATGPSVPRALGDGPRPAVTSLDTQAPRRPFSRQWHMCRSDVN
jgi:hypothetical protein